MALAPPPSGVTVFAELVRPGGPVTIDGAEFRAISLGQLMAVLAHAQRRCQTEGWLGVRFPGGVKCYVRVDPETINLYDVATHVILPATHGHLLADGTNKPCFVELVADGAQRPEYFVSHFCAPPALALSLARAVRLRRRAPPVWSHLRLCRRGGAAQGFCRVRRTAHARSGVRRRRVCDG